MPGIMPIRDEEHERRFREWLPKFEARLAENRRRMKLYCAAAKIRQLLKKSRDSASTNEEKT